MSNEAVWTGWIAHGNKNANPIPEWAEYYRAQCKDSFTMLEGNDPSHVQWDLVLAYRYVIPADLAHIAKHAKPADFNGSIPVSAFALGNGEYQLDDYLRARRDLRYEQPCNKTQDREALGPESGEPDPSADDPVNHPQHYMLSPELEAIDVIKAALTPAEYMGYLKGSILKYRLRAGRKGEAEQDIAKSDWYRARALEEYDQ